MSREAEQVCSSCSEMSGLTTADLPAECWILMSAIPHLCLHSRDLVVLSVVEDDSSGENTYRAVNDVFLKAHYGAGLHVAECDGC